MIHKKDDLVDLVDEDGKLIATKSYSEILELDLHNFRLVIATIKRGNDFLIVRRSYDRTYPGAMANVGGYVKSGETYEDALYRIVQERLGTNIKDKKLSFLGYATPNKDETVGYVAMYEIDGSDLSIVPSKDYYAEVLWLSPEQIKERLAAKDQSTPDFPIVMRKFYGIER